MKVLILSVSAGGGHVHAAKAIETYIKLNDPDSEICIIDTLKYINPLIDKVVIGSYLKSIKINPSLFGKLYHYTENEEGFSNVSNKFNELMTYRILPLINDFSPDIIICTHFFPAEMLSILKLKNKINIPCVCLLTDYSPHNAWLHSGIDAYIVSNSDMIEEMENRGVQKSIVYSLGIPVKPDFLTKYDKLETLSSMGLDPQKTTLLVMGGSLGLGKITKIYDEISKIGPDIQIIVITGNNKKLYSELMKQKDSSLKETRVIGYTNEVNKYMQSCDLLLTKPGGLTITEALISKTPLALFSPIPGQEEQNAQFLIKHKLAINIGKGKNCRIIIEQLLSNPSSLQEMRENCAKYSKPNSGNDIYKLVSSLVKKS